MRGMEEEERRRVGRGCFGCGHLNPKGLKLAFRLEDGVAVAEFDPDPEHRGYPGLMHGGLVATILDEAMAYTYFPETKGVTAKAEFRFKQPAPVGMPLVVTARLVKRTRKILTTQASIALRDGTVIAECTAQAYVVSPGGA